MAGVLDRLDAGAVRRWARDALDRLGSHRDEIDGLNVYPVPDGDTGTNLYLTVESAVAAVEQLPDDDNLPEVADALATGALHGARGSSGVILSQLLRGWAEALREHPDGGARAVRTALSRAADSAYAAVSRPSEGTMLSVARAAAEGAGRGGGSLREVVSGALTAARSALDRTPGQLDALGRAGVVDAGGRGLILVLESLAGTVTGRRVVRGPGGDQRNGPAGNQGAGQPAAEPQQPVAGEGFPFEVMYLVDGPEAAVQRLRNELERLGDSVVVVGGAAGGAVASWKVHVHTADVAGVLSAGTEVGPLRQVRVALVHAAPSDLPTQDRVSVVAVAAGVGPARLLAAAGAFVVVRSGTDLGAGELLQAVRHASPGAVVVLPDDELCAAAAAQAAEVDARDAPANAAAEGVAAGEREPRVSVLQPCAPVQALAALAVHDPGDSLHTMADRMGSAAAATRHGAVRRSVARIPTDPDRTGPDRTPTGHRPGDAVGLVGDEVIAAAPDALAVARDVADRLLEPGGELLTVLVDARPEAVEVGRSLCAHLRETRPDVEVHVLDGGAEGHPDGALLLMGAE